MSVFLMNVFTDFHENEMIYEKIIRKNQMKNSRIRKNPGVF